MLSGIRLYGLIGFVAALAIFIGFALHWKHQAADRKEKLVLICQTTRTAADNPKLACGQVAVQIAELGKSVVNLKAEVKSQNVAVNALAAESARQKAAAIEAARRADKAARGAQAVSDRLAASSRSPAAPSASQCKPSKVLEEQWR